MIVRVSSRAGIKPISDLTPETTIKALKAKISQVLSIPPSDQALSIRTNNQTKTLSSDQETLSTYNIRNGDLIFLTSPQTTQDKSTARQAPIVTKVDVTNQSNILHNSLKPPESSQTSVIEDPVDVALHKEDGWTKRPISRYCQHGPKGSCQRCMPIAPWSIQNYEPWLSQKLKHIPFHAWFRERSYRNSQILLSAETYVQKSENSKYEKLQNLSVFCSGQNYRHVDHVEFETSDLVERFLAFWRKTGQQRVGFLYGRYEPEPTIPLGIRATVAAIYEPPQSIRRKDPMNVVGYDSDPDQERVDGIAKMLNLTRLGMVWTSLKTNEKKQIITDREDDHPLTARECLIMANYQNKFPNVWDKAVGKKFGSKFVSVLIHGNKEGNVDLQAYQMSDQCCDLIREDAIRPSKQDPNKFRVRKSTPEVLYPDILYRQPNEYGYTVQFKAEPTFPLLFFVVSVRHGFPKKPEPTFSRNQFPIENRKGETQTIDLVRVQTSNCVGSEYFNALNDFHLLLYLSKHVDEDLFSAIIKGVKDPRSVRQDEIKSSLDNVINRHQQLNSSAPVPPGQKPTQEQELLQQLLGMGYPEDIAKEALWATGNRSIEAAIEFLLQR
eukprot:TRINITY_DN1368_c0_g2_i1.p1 TRINITY_DN1368_c0_g2~~TRINITY_DN1368_c0_g2_i1.p1  ORF type:complete len:609 (-),score=95.40 TRINITY_DN1368_c0_g2_i1:86-1912(-)